MTQQEAASISLAGKAKAALAHDAPGRYFTRAMLAGCFIFIGTVVSSLSSAWLYTDSVPAAKLLGAFTFSTALVLIVLLGAELFTGSNFIMGFTLYSGAATVSSLVRVWLLCYAGNYAGILILSLLLSGSGASREMLSAYLAIVVPGKLSLPWYQFLLRGALCNLCVCIGVFSSFRIKSEAARIPVIIAVVFTFVMAGFEHSIANMAYFTLYALLVPGAASSATGIASNLIWVTIGNVLGGSVLLALPMWYLSDRCKTE